MAASIVAVNLTKRYGRGQALALDNLSFEIQPGEVYGYLGANGAGKSTTIRLLMNFLQPTSGSATITGFDSVRDTVAIKKHVGYLAGDVALYTKPTGRELLDYLAALQGGVDKTYRRQLETQLQADLDKPLGSLSKGNRQKIGIIQALMHQPKVLILDEPTSGLDPLMQEVFYAAITTAKDRGTAVLMSSHNLAEAERICDRIGIVKHGKLIHEQNIGTDTELGKPIFRVVLAKPSAVAQLRKSSHLTVLSQEGSNTVLLQPKGTIASALQALGQFEIRDFTTQQMNLEDEFIEYYGDKA